VHVAETGLLHHVIEAARELQVGTNAAERAEEGGLEPVPCGMRR
jgi:hypothetical protein